jgi:hypothetical protein
VIDVLIGKTLKSIKGKVGDSELILTTDDGKKYRMYHNQDCCESVYLEDIVGNLQDLIGSPILKASEDTNSETNPPDAHKETIEYQDNFTWTFYNLSTAKGTVTIRWYGESDGYYSEEADFEEVK